MSWMHTCHTAKPSHSSAQLGLTFTCLWDVSGQPLQTVSDACTRYDYAQAFVIRPASPTARSLLPAARLEA